MDPGLLDKLVIVRSHPEIGMVNVFTNLIALDKWDASILFFLENIDLWNISIAPNRAIYRELFRVDQFERVIAGVQRLFKLRERAVPQPIVRLQGRSIASPFEVDPRIIEIDPEKNRQESWNTTYCDWGGMIPDQPHGTPVIRASSDQDKTQICTMPLMTAVVFCEGSVGFCGCSDFDGFMVIGDLKTESLESILAGRRRSLYMEAFPNKTLNRHCRQCTFYLPCNKQELAGWAEGTHPLWPQFGARRTKPI
jgi:hypothetical protein